MTTSQRADLNAGPSGHDPLGDAVRQVRTNAILTLDPDGVIQSWNEGAYRLKGWTAQEAIGRHFSMFYPPADREDRLPWRLLDQARSAGHVEHTGWRVRKDGTRFWGDIAITAVHGEDGQHVGFVKVTRDVTDRHAAEEALRAKEERFRLLVSQVVDYAIIFLDTDGTVASWNAGAERVKGWTAEEAIGLHFSMFYPEEDRRDGLPERLLERARAEGNVEHDGWRVRKDGTRFWGDVAITAIHDGHGGLTGYGKVTRDRTEARHVEELREALFSGITHDLRTPIASILGFTQLLPGSRDEAERVELTQGIRSNAEHLNALVSALLEYARLRSGNVTLAIEDVDVAAAARDVVGLLAPVLENRTVRLPSTAHVVRADPTALGRVLTNLLANAAVYSQDATTITVQVARAGDSVRVEVVDEGRGIDPRDLDTIFDDFARGRLAQDRRGVGLGLAVVKLLVTLQDGEVWIDSELGHGTTVGFGLPAAT